MSYYNTIVTELRNNFGICGRRETARAAAMLFVLSTAALAVASASVPVQAELIDITLPITAGIPVFESSKGLHKFWRRYGTSTSVW
jgi:hypothetical protein